MVPALYPLLSTFTSQSLSGKKVAERTNLSASSVTNYKGISPLAKRPILDKIRDAWLKDDTASTAITLPWLISIFEFDHAEQDRLFQELMAGNKNAVQDAKAKKKGGKDPADKPPKMAGRSAIEAQISKLKEGVYDDSLGAERVPGAIMALIWAINPKDNPTFGVESDGPIE